MNVKERLRQIILESGYHGLMYRLLYHFVIIYKIIKEILCASFRATYLKTDQSFFVSPIIDSKGIKEISAENLIPEEIIDHYLTHRFDLLGSGWVQVKYGMRCRGLEDHRFDMSSLVKFTRDGRWLKGRINRHNLPQSQKIWGLIEPSYQPVDWQIDFKSGYRWSEKSNSKQIRFGDVVGADIKLPWELARMQHLVQLALRHNSFPTMSEKRRILEREFRNQVLDFTATNPPRFGVNWSCSMDVAIRAANWVLAYSIFRSGETVFDEEFEAVFAKSLYEHGRHIVSNLEWHDQKRSNHYLANITGLAFIAASLYGAPEIDTWLAFSVQEMIAEVKYQFLNDGGNFEGSTSYHRLSSEMVLYATALIVGMPNEKQKVLSRYNHRFFKKGWGTPGLKPAPMNFYPLPKGSISANNEGPFPSWFFKQVELMAEFIIDISNSDNRMLQIGDNDSGRFTKIEPIYRKITVKEAKDIYANLNDYTELQNDAYCFMEDHLDGRHLVAGAYGLFDRRDFATFLNGRENAFFSPDCVIIRCLTKGIIIGSQRHNEKKEDIVIGKDDDFPNILSEIQALDRNFIKRYDFTAVKGDIQQDLTRCAYPEFGLYIFRSPRLYIAIRCITGNKFGHTGHMHLDQFSLDLILEGNNIIRDPGTYLYTPLLAERWRYRSAGNHFSPYRDNSVSQSALSNAFSSITFDRAHVRYFGEKGFYAEACSDGSSIQLCVTISSKMISIYHINQSACRIEENVFSALPFSPGYGIKEHSHYNVT